MTIKSKKPQTPTSSLILETFSYSNTKKSLYSSKPIFLDKKTIIETTFFNIAFNFFTFFLDGQLWKEVKQEVDYLLKPQVLAEAERHVRTANLSRIVLIDNLQQVIEVENPPAEEIAQLQNRKGKFFFFFRFLYRNFKILLQTTNKNQRNLRV